MTDYIDRDAVISEIERREVLMVGDKRISIDAMKSFIKNRPSVDVAPIVHGHWIEYQIPHIICCSNCDWATDVVEKNFQYCPMCGTQMDGGDG